VNSQVQVVSKLKRAFLLNVSSFCFAKLASTGTA
jgi:hypothetical protein